MPARSGRPPRRLAATLVPGVALVLLVVLVVATGCGGSSSAPTPARTASAASASGTATVPLPVPPSVSPSDPASPVARDDALKAELIAMQECDQGRCLPAQEKLTQQGRETRLREILAAHGWPGYDLVGRRGGDAAWLIVQHADLDPAFQRDALELLRDAVDRGQASAGNLAYLDDRIAVAEGRPQTYGTQIRCDGAGGRPRLATPLANEGAVEQLRAAAGIEPLADYLVEMTRLCAG